jgi:hypothetical protein
MRALHVRQLAEHFEHDEMWERLQAFAAELEAQADAIEVAAEEGEWRGYRVSRGEAKQKPPASRGRQFLVSSIKGGRLHHRQAASGAPAEHPTTHYQIVDIAARAPDAAVLM